MGAVLLCARITIALCGLQTQAHLARIVVGDGKAEATADAVLRAVTLYEAAVFPLTPQGASAQEQQARRPVTTGWRCRLTCGLSGVGHGPASSTRST